MLQKEAVAQEMTDLIKELLSKNSKSPQTRLFLTAICDIIYKCGFSRIHGSPGLPEKRILATRSCGT